MLVLVALFVVVFGAIEAAKTWGLLSALGVGLAGFVVALFFPLGFVIAAVGSIALGAAARTARMRRVMAALDETPEAAEVRARTVARSDNPFTSTDTAPLTEDPFSHKEPRP